VFVPLLENIEMLTASFVGIVWGIPLIILLVGSGLFFTFYFGCPQFLFFKDAFRILFGGVKHDQKYKHNHKHNQKEDRKESQALGLFESSESFDSSSSKKNNVTCGEISHFQALTSALSATVGLGNIAGVSVALSVGGPGAIFWLWVTGLVGMCTKFVEVTLSVKYREVTPSGRVHGGPMYVIKKGLPKSLHFLGFFYAVFIILSSFGSGNMFQSNQVALILNKTIGIPEWASGIFLALGAFLILVGGIKRIGQVTGRLVPAMISVYFLGAVVILFHHFDRIGSVFTSIFQDAFTGSAAVGGFAGVAFKEALIMGIRRASFSNEAGMGSSAIAHSAAKTEPIQEGIVALLEPFIDTIVVCSITAFALLLTGVWSQSGVGVGSEMTAYAFESVMGPWGRWIVTLTVSLFAFSTIISWSYYGEQGVVFLFGENRIPLFRYVFVGFVFLGAVFPMSIVLNLSDIFYGLLALPNMIACYLLFPEVKTLMEEYKKNSRK
jgi:alanine or glycine:cation symporter, AGCS family